MDARGLDVRPRGSASPGGANVCGGWQQRGEQAKLTSFQSLFEDSFDYSTYIVFFFVNITTEKRGCNRTFFHNAIRLTLSRRRRRRRRRQPPPTHPHPHSRLYVTLLHPAKGSQLPPSAGESVLRWALANGFEYVEPEEDVGDEGGDMGSGSAGFARAVDALQVR